VPVTLTAAFRAFVDDPGPSTYLAARALVLSGPSYTKDPTALATAADLLDQGENKGVIDAIDADLPNLLLSPAAHAMLAIAHKNLGDLESADFERDVYASLIELGILASGDGTEASPYRVVHPSDIDDAIGILGVAVNRQQVVRGEDTRLECIDLADGRALWFDAP